MEKRIENLHDRILHMIEIECYELSGYEEVELLNELAASIEDQSTELFLSLAREDGLDEECGRE